MSFAKGIFCCIFVLYLKGNVEEKIRRDKTKNKRVDKRIRPEAKASIKKDMFMGL